MSRIFEIVNRTFTHRVFMLAALLWAVAGVACAEDSTEDEGVNENGFKIRQTATNADGAAIVNCNGNQQSVSLVFNVAEDYVISTDGSEWLTIVAGSTGEAGSSRSVKLSLTANLGEDIREATVSITIGDAEPCTFAVVKQSVKTIDAVTQWIDERLSAEYYWMETYNELKAAGKIDFSKTGEAFLTDALTGRKWNNINKADGYTGVDNKWHIFSYIKDLSATRTRATDADKVSGYGVELCNIIIDFGNGTYGFIIEHTYPSSPAFNAGLRRGDMIMKVNGQYISDSNYLALLDNIQGSSGSSLKLSIYIPGGNGATQDYTLSKGSYHESPVAYCGVLAENTEMGFDFGDRKIGYISYLSFDGNYDKELIQAMERLRNAGATDIVIDLRTNGGGSVLSATYFTSMLLPSSYEGKVFATLKRHKDNINGDSEITFYANAQVDDKTVIELPHLSNLQNIYFITSDYTASASEMLIMGLRTQGVKVVTVGTQSLGKDCGMDVITRPFGAKRYEYAPITFMNIFPNHIDYADGIPADVDFAKLLKQETDKDMLDLLDWYPLPEIGGNWGDYTIDIALAEAVANIIGKTIFESKRAQSELHDLPRMQVTRSQQRCSKAFAIPQPVKVSGMYLSEEQRELLKQK